MAPEMFGRRATDPCADGVRAVPVTVRRRPVACARGSLALGLATVLLLGAPAAWSQESTPVQLPTDPVLKQLVEQSLAARPELKQAEANLRAQREQIPQAGALPDPVLTLGLQMDWGHLTPMMETDYYQVMASQTFPWPGKRALRTEVAKLGASQGETSVGRARLSTEADVRRAYLDLLLARDRLALLDRLEALWKQSAGLARSRYEAGEGAQSDVLRAQLELNRLRQRRFALKAEERTRVQTLNRLRAHPLDEPIESGTSVRELGVPALPDLQAALADAEARSPELAGAGRAVTRAEKATALARRERYPDLTLNAGVMPRGGDFPPMWQASVSFNLPVFAGRKQNRAVAEQAARREAETSNAEAVAQLLRLRVAERREAMVALEETIRLFRDGLLVQSQATVDSTLAQYRVGRVTFASVLEANVGLVNDEESYLQALAEAQRLAIGAAEVSLEPVVVGASGGGMSTATLPGAGAMGSAPPASAAPAAGGGPATPSTQSPSMRGM